MRKNAAYITISILDLFTLDDRSIHLEVTLQFRPADRWKYEELWTRNSASHMGSCHPRHLGPCDAISENGVA